MLASSTRIRGFKTGRSRWIFLGIWKILRMPSFGGEVKESVPYPSFAACKRTCYIHELQCARKIPCIVPSFASRGLLCLCGVWRLWRWMRGTHWGKGTIGLQAAVPKRPHTWPLTFFLNHTLLNSCLLDEWGEGWSIQHTMKTSNSNHNIVVMDNEQTNFGKCFLLPTLPKNSS